MAEMTVWRPFADEQKQAVEIEIKAKGE